MFMVSLYYFAKVNIYTAEKSQGAHVPFVSEENTNMEVNECDVEDWTGLSGVHQSPVGSDWYHVPGIFCTAS